MIDSGEPHTLVQCVGSPYRRDDGVGLLIADELKTRIRCRGIGIESYWGEGTQLMARWPGWRRVYIVDAAHSGAAAGTLHRIDAGRTVVPTNLFYYSTHRFGVAEAVEMARALGGLPETLRLYGIEGADFSAGEGLSPAVEDGAQQLVDELTQVLGAENPRGSHRQAV